MAEYSKLTINFVSSPNSDYSAAEITAKGIAAYEETPDHVWRSMVKAATGGSVFNTTIFSTLESVVIKNNDTSNFVTVAYTSENTTSNSIKLLAGSICVLPDVDPASSITLTADTAALECDVIASGSIA